MNDLNVKWNFYREGNSGGVPIVFLHGFMGHGKIWLPTIRQLPENVYAISLDLPGHGQTEADLEKLDFNTLSDSLNGFVNDQELDRPVIVGYSMGGRIALYTALRFPDKFRAMVIESATAGIKNETDRRERLHHDRAVADRLRQFDMREFLEGWYKQPVFAYLADEIKNKIIEKKTGNDPFKLAEAVTRLSTGLQPSLWQKLSRWNKPALIIAGETDLKYLGISRKMASKIPSSELKIIKNAGHIVHLENFKEFSSALNFFLRSYIL